VVSQSPTAESSAEELLRYDSGWAATNRLLRAGKSFSGRERHCSFLNLGPGKSFANISSVSGLDLIDDGRALASCDWDYDGRVDFWLTNRTGPRVRLLKNQLVTDNRFLALRLQGASNRDAFGARVEVQVKGEKQPRIKSLYGGSGFLAQSSKWLRFGLATDGEIEKVTVRWPGGDAEEFTGTEPDGHFILAQKSGSAKRWTPPTAKIVALPLAETDPPSTSRVILLKPAPMPTALPFVDATGKPGKLGDLKGRPTLLNLWATWCPNCLAEMKQWSQEKAQFKAAGLEVLTLCIDEPTENLQADLEKMKSTADKFGSDFPLAFAQGNTSAVLNVLQKTFIGRQTDLPLPTSFLIDAEGRLAAIYLGPVNVDQVITDMKILNATAEEVLSVASGFKGRWLEQVTPTLPRNFAVHLVDHGMRLPAADYLRQIIPHYRESDPKGTEHIESNAFLGAILFDEKQFEQAVPAYRTALTLDPSKRAAREQLARALAELGRPQEALVELEHLHSVRREPQFLLLSARLERGLGNDSSAIALFKEAISIAKSPPAQWVYELAKAQSDSGDAAGAIGSYKETLRLQPGWFLPANNLAWLLSTHPDDALRDGVEAVAIANAACKATNNEIPHLFGTLAAAHAETGDFTAALAAIDEAIRISESHNDTELAATLAEKRAIYLSEKPFRQKRP